jgi:hypothetical protein
MEGSFLNISHRKAYLDIATSERSPLVCWVNQPERVCVRYLVLSQEKPDVYAFRLINRGAVQLGYALNRGYPTILV